MPRTRPEVNPKISVPKKKLGAKGVGSGDVRFGDGEVKEVDRRLMGFFRGGRRNGDSRRIGDKNS